MGVAGGVAGFGAGQSEGFGLVGDGACAPGRAAAGAGDAPRLSPLPPLRARAARAAASALLISASITSRSSNGFRMTLRAPMVRAVSTFSGVALAVITRISGLKLSFCMSAISSSPVKPGMWMSVRTMSMRFSVNCRTASLPFPAMRRRNSGRAASSSFRSLRMFGSSSMMRRL